MSDTVFLKPYGPNEVAEARRVGIGRLMLWFSYNQCIAFEVGNPRKCTKPTVCLNDGGAIARKHRYWVDGGDVQSRLPREEFEAKLNAVVRAAGLALPELVG